MAADERSGQSEEMLRYITTTIAPRSGGAVDIDTPLFTSGLVDSLGLVDVVLQLERVAGVKIPVGRLRPADIDTVRLMIDAAHRLGRKDVK